MIDCSIAKNYLIEKARMTDFCTIPCSDCPLSYDNGEIGEYCENFEGKYPAKAIAIVQKWSDEHPPKTRLLDFIEKYPNTKLSENGLPVICACKLGYTKKCDKDHNCVKCWNEPLEDKK